ncbi:hypothetical protein [Pedobacter nutrimenti]|uniref:hypothetical protein n=1 Tax=Pedobacter nutrimenti TaxID=1241337 RepID=UPI0029308F4E|nr:hypothetical protein [Pedobacter nutrimenti]
MIKSDKLIGYQLKSISSNQFAIIDDLYIYGETPKLDASFAFAFEYERRIISCRAKFSFHSSKGLFMIIEGSCHFDIELGSWKEMIQDNGRLKIEKNFAAHMSSLTIGTVRGMLHAKTEQTIYNLIFIPVINVEEFINEDVIIDPRSNPVT